MAVCNEASCHRNPDFMHHASAYSGGKYEYADIYGKRNH
ncbi:hypothetical protein L21SP2_0553 [Salinispira pacifica]|uniref:Uncharacterized protein n=1 Tax=Salinispira pacifica TaxID=1307761 RepID=V5WEC0_9SPIO|nr:hypothetical protein L21SP2_0553 [Salinispira pacifica]